MLAAMPALPQLKSAPQRDIGMLHSAAGGDVLWYMVAMRETAKQRALCKGKG
jgi:hypothetical protein